MRGQGGRLASRRPGPLEAFGLRPIAAAAPPCRCCLSLVTAAVSRTRDRPRPAPVTRDRPLPVPVTTLLLLLLSAALLNAAHTAAAQMIHAGTLLLLGGALAGSALAVKRIGRCHPWGGCGHDPVPPAENGRRNLELF